MSLVAMQQRIVIGPGKSRHCQLESIVATCGMKTYSKSRIELQNLQILKKMLESQVIFVIRAAL